MFFVIILCSFLIVSCSKIGDSYKQYSCLDCHRGLISKKSVHAELSCHLCHGGKEPARSKTDAHKNLSTNPDFLRVESVCMQCHNYETEKFKNSLHYTYRRELRTILSGFNLKFPTITMIELVQTEQDASTREGLIFDFLKRRCLSCHIYSMGENYSKTRRSLSCLSCHPPHSYSKPNDETCLSCHYSIRIGWDYYGFFPHNWFWDYRSPFINGKLPDRPYGIEAYKLEEDIHRKRGLTCSDCHTKEEIMFGKKGKTCKSCHQDLKNQLFHRNEVLKRIRCEVCHARYIAQDEVKICYLSYDIDLDEWEGLVVQESSEVEEKLTALLHGNQVEISMRDKFSGKELPGIWLCTLANRTFNKINIGKDRDGILCLVRREKIELKAENLKVNSTVIGIFETCKVPHTIGRGDLNRSLRLLKSVR